MSDLSDEGFDDICSLRVQMLSSSKDGGEESVKCAFKPETLEQFTTG